MPSDLLDILRTARDTGPSGFEGLIAELLESLTGLSFNLAISGSQDGRDMSSHRPYANVIAVECKRYGKDSELDADELAGKFTRAGLSILDLDLWVLVASRKVPSQLKVLLKKAAINDGVEFFAISAGDGVPSSLEALCAYSPKVMAAHPAVHSAIGEENLVDMLRRITEEPEYSKRISDLKYEFSTPLVGYENWRKAQNQWFLSSLRSYDEAYANHQQTLNVEDPNVKLIPRKATWDTLSKWLQTWESHFDFFTLLGEEGDGKTWSVASWLGERLRNDPEFPAVVFLSSKNVSSEDPRGLLEDAISSQLSNLSMDQISRRLGRWISRPAGPSPIVLLILDGINQHRTPEWWRNLLGALAGDLWTKHTAVLLTCRIAYWEHYFAGLRNLTVRAYTITPYDDTELDLALTDQGVSRQDIQTELLPLICKPRCFDLMAGLHHRIEEIGVVTVARLIYEDWRDKYQRKTSIPLTDQDFQNLIRQLAKAQHSVDSLISSQEVAAAVPLFSEHRQVLEELQTGRILQPENGMYKVNKRFLVHGLGLLLVDQLNQSSNRQRDPREVIAEWLEPHAEMDIKAEICEFAALHALSVKNLPLNARVALLEFWVASQNPSHYSEGKLTSYLPIDPEAYVELAESLWSDTRNNRWAQELVTWAFIDWYKSPKVSSILFAAFERWLGFVHINGLPKWRRTTEDNEKSAKEIAENFGGSVELGKAQFAGYPLTIVNNDGLLRLARVALSVISHLPRAQFIPVLTIGCIAEAIMGRPEKYDLFAWILKSSPENVWVEVKKEAELLVATKRPLTLKVASRLLSFEGGEAAKDFERTLPEDIFPPNPLLAMHEKDPCTSGFSWREQDCVTCLQREDIPIDIVARQIGPYCVDPDLPVPESLKTKFGSLIEKIDKENLWTALGRTEANHWLETYEPALAAYLPATLATLVRSAARQIATRVEMGRRQLSIHLVEHYLVLTNEEFGAVLSAWRELLSVADRWEEPDEVAEEYLFKIILSQISGNDQLSSLLGRPERAFDLLDFEDSFENVDNWDLIRAELAKTDEKKVLSRCLWFLSASPGVIPHDVLNTSILGLLNHEYNYVRSLVLEIVYGAKESNAIRSIIDGNWSWVPSDEGHQNHWGSLIISEFGQSLPFDELCRRIHPGYLGYAIVQRGNKPDEIEYYAGMIDQLWSRLNNASIDLPADLPQFSLDFRPAEDVKQVARLSLDEDESRSITIIGEHSTRGGVEVDEETNLEDFFDSKKTLDRHRKLLNILKETIRDQRAAGNEWFGQSFHTESLDKVIEMHPELGTRWVSQAIINNSNGRSLILRGASFYAALCDVLLKESTTQGIELYCQLKKTRGRMRLVDRETQIESIDFAFFEGVQSNELTIAWREQIEKCDTDQQLMQIALLSQFHADGTWLWSYIREGIDSIVPIDKARSIVLLGFSENEESIGLIQQLLEEDSDFWPGELARTAKRRQDVNKWAKHWFNRFLTTDNDVTAWASFRLFLRCVTSSFWFWRETMEKTAGEGKLDRKRKTFFRNNFGNIQKAIKENEKDATEQFLGQKILKGQVWPWM